MALLPTDPKERKAIPIYSGVIKYFPDALIAIAKVSKSGNDQHNPGQPLHWSRGKSDDHHDTLTRHLFESGTIDTDGHRHSAKAAWRALAILQLEIEASQQSTLSGEARDAEQCAKRDASVKDYGAGTVSIPQQLYPPPFPATEDKLNVGEDVAVIIAPAAATCKTFNHGLKTGDWTPHNELRQAEAGIEPEKNLKRHEKVADLRHYPDSNAVCEECGKSWGSHFGVNCDNAAAHTDRRWTVKV